MVVSGSGKWPFLGGATLQPNKPVIGSKKQKVNY
jgi:hypothetical protein